MKPAKCGVVLATCFWLVMAGAETWALQPPEIQDQARLILVVGAEGQPEYGQQFRRWAERWQQAALEGGVPCSLIGLNPATEAQTSPSADASTATAANEDDRNRLLEQLSVEGAKETREPLWVVFLGHGTFDQKSARLNLRGPDISADEMAAACRDNHRPLVVVLCSSCSSPFINALSGPDRVIITATKDGNEVQYSRFGEAFSLAIGSPEADVDRDSQTSLLEAWLYAARRTDEFYRSEGRLATEHALLEDNGDAKGVRAELFDGLKPASTVQKDDSAAIDGQKAAKLCFVRSEAERRLTADQQITRDALEAQLELLKQRKSNMDQTEYLQQLETIFRALAEIYESAEGQSP